MLIGLTGHAAAGKDSVAAALCAAGWRGVAFADALRWEVAAAWGVDPALLADRRSKEQPTAQMCAGAAQNANWLRWAAVNGISLIERRSPRWALQQWGSWRRQGDPLHWVRQVDYWVRYQRQKGVATGLVVTDVRYQDEAAMLRGLGGRIVRVHRPGLPALPPDTASHESEGHTAIACDADLHNDGSLLDLQSEVQRVLQLLATQPAPINHEGPNHA